QRTRTAFPISLEDPGERPFLPSFTMVPDAVKADIRARIQDPRFRSRMGEHVVALIEKMLAAGNPASLAPGKEARQKEKRAKRRGRSTERRPAPARPGMNLL